MLSHTHLNYYDAYVYETVIKCLVNLFYYNILASKNSWEAREGKRFQD